MAKDTQEDLAGMIHTVSVAHDGLRQQLIHGLIKPGHIPEPDRVLAIWSFTPKMENARSKSPVFRDERT